MKMYKISILCMFCIWQNDFGLNICNVQWFYLLHFQEPMDPHAVASFSYHQHRLPDFRHCRPFSSHRCHPRLYRYCQQSHQLPQYQIHYQTFHQFHHHFHQQTYQQPHHFSQDQNHLRPPPPQAPPSCLSHLAAWPGWLRCLFGLPCGPFASLGQLIKSVFCFSFNKEKCESIKTIHRIHSMQSRWLTFHSERSAAWC